MINLLKEVSLDKEVSLQAHNLTDGLVIKTNERDTN